MRVVVTGIGLVTGLGPGRETTWAALRAGHRGPRWLDHIEADRTPYAGVPVAGEPLDPDADPVLDVLQRATREAVADAGLDHRGVDPERLGCLIGLSKGGVRSLARLHKAILDGEVLGDAHRRALVSCLPGAGASQVAGWLGAQGPCLAPVAACATGLVAVLQGADLIRHGVCDAVLAGAADASLEPLILAAFRRMRALARCGPDDDPAAVVRPLDRGRTGFLVGEGAAVLVLEREDRAMLRGVDIYARVAGGAVGSDAYHVTDLDPDPTNLAGLIGRALRNSGTGASEIDHINLHGTATRPNDPLECRAIRQALGPRVAEVSCTANKAQIGHLLGAAGAAELAITCLALRDGIIPPTMNLLDPDPACGAIDATPLVARPRAIRAALKLSLGFGGHLAAAVLHRP